jgi:hypothetical protein
MRPLLSCAFLAILLPALHLSSCAEETNETNDSGVHPVVCTELDEAACVGAPACAWRPDGCHPTDAGISDAAAECGADTCPPDACGWVLADGQLICISKPDCTGLDEATCSATVGCVAVKGRLATDPPGTMKYVGCGDGTGTPGALITCTAPGPEGPCWVIQVTWVPAGWPKWACGDHPTTTEECMQQAPFDAGSD